MENIEDAEWEDVPGNAGILVRARPQNSPNGGRTNSLRTEPGPGVRETLRDKLEFASYMGRQLLIAAAVVVGALVVFLFAAAGAADDAGETDQKDTGSISRAVAAEPPAPAQMTQQVEVQPKVDRTDEITTSFGAYAGNAVCEGEYWQIGKRNGRRTLAWMEDNGTPELAADDYYVEYDFFYDGRRLYLTNGVKVTYRFGSPTEGQRVSDKSFPMKQGGNGWVLNGEQLDACRN